ncbi:NAD-binding protein [Halegenticoccus soli]|uniref:NAD-binding protein n=1 Tax=Halegenticoccus soli TaxID=1985678 RepID=UPI0018EBDC98|nr:NAD-binding protein [Halegenticoccus soli]
MATRSRQYRPGKRTTVWLVIATGLASIATGIAAIATGAGVGPLGAVVPEWIRNTAAFSGTVLGFFLLLAAYGLRRGFRVAAVAAAALALFSAAHGLAQSSPYSAPLVLLSVAAFVALLSNRGRFDRRLSLSQSQAAVLTAVVGVLAYGTVGSYAIRREFSGLETLFDAFYFTLVTASTVGYGDVTPQSEPARLFALSLVVLGPASLGVAVGTLFAPAIEGRLSDTLGRMTDARLARLEDHVVVLGYDDPTKPVLEELADRTTFVVITPDEDRAARLSDRNVDVLTADPTDEETLERVQIGEAAAVVAATWNEAEDALAVLTARQVSPEVRIVAVSVAGSADKLRRAGADVVIDPRAIFGRMTVDAALDGGDGVGGAGADERGTVGGADGSEETGESNEAGEGGEEDEGATGETDETADGVDETDGRP